MHRVRRFAGDERGSFVIFSLFLLITIFIVAGLGVDVMRYEAQRTKLQNTLDRAILAAADMSQKMTPLEVVTSYFEKAGLGDYVPSVDSHTTFNSKTVTATGAGRMDTFFLSWLGIARLDPFASGAAEESISDIEISLVLDVSGSMNDPVYTYETVQTRYGSRTYKYNTGQTKIEALQGAANEFVDTIFNSTALGRTTMSVVPYSTQVNLGPTLAGQFNLTTEHSYSHCVDFSASDFSSPAILPTTLLKRSGHFDPIYGNQTPQFRDCGTNTNNYVMPLGSTASSLKSRINNLAAGGNTSIEIGMKWGAALLDPAAQPAVTNLIATSDIANTAASRPYVYNNPDTMKVIVVMTDGINTASWDLKDAYKSGPSGVYKYTSGGTTYYSVAAAEGSNTDRDGDGVKNEAYWVESECLRVLKSNGSCTTKTDSSSKLNPAKWQASPKGGGSAVQLTFPQLWAEMGVEWHAQMRKSIYDKSSDLSAWRDVYTEVNNDSPTYTKDNRLDTICSAAKGEGVIVFAIGFEVTDASATVLQKCASSVSHFYRVQGLEITTAFQSIANAIGKLRLTQ